MLAPHESSPLQQLPPLVRSLYAGLRGADPFGDFLRELGRMFGLAGATLDIRLSGAEDAPAALHWHRDAGEDKPPCPARTVALEWPAPAGRRFRLALHAPDTVAEAARSYLEALGPDLETACALYLDLAAARDQEALYTRMLDRLGIGAMAIDATGRILHLSAAAESLLQRHALLSRSGDDARLSPQGMEDPAMRGALAASLAPAPRDGPAECPGLWPVSLRHASGMVLNLTFRPAPAAVSPLLQRHGTALVTLCEASGSSAPSIRTLSQLYGLSPAESALAVLLAQGLDLNGASAILAITRNTAKSHLRKIFGKTRVCQQSSLVRLLLRSVDELTPVTLAPATPPDPNARGTIRPIAKGGPHERYRETARHRGDKGAESRQSARDGRETLG